MIFLILPYIIFIPISLYILFFFSRYIVEQPCILKPLVAFCLESIEFVERVEVLRNASVPCRKQLSSAQTFYASVCSTGLKFI